MWISAQFRPEHRQTIDWLNANTVEGLAFFGVEVELLQIEESPYAPHFKLVAQPNDWQKAVRAKAESQPSEKGLVYQRFWTDLLAHYKKAFPTQRTANKAPPQNWLTIAGAGRSGFAYNLSFTGDAQMRVELTIYPGDSVANKAAFDQLMTQKEGIEDEMGEELSWERHDNIKSSWVATYRAGQVADAEPVRTQHIEWGRGDGQQISTGVRPETPHAAVCLRRSVCPDIGRGVLIGRPSSRAWRCRLDSPRQLKAHQAEERLRLGPAWSDSGQRSPRRPGTSRAGGTSTWTPRESRGVARTRPVTRRRLCSWRQASIRRSSRNSSDAPQSP